MLRKNSKDKNIEPFSPKFIDPDLNDIDNKKDYAQKNENLKQEHNEEIEIENVDDINNNINDNFEKNIDQKESILNYSLSNLNVNNNIFSPINNKYNDDIKSITSGGFHFLERSNNTQSFNKFDISRQKGALLFDKVKERKTFEEKVHILKTRVKKLKEQEVEINKKLNNDKKKIYKVDKIRDDVLENKKKIQSDKEIRKKKYEDFKIELQKEKELRKIKLLEIKENSKKEKEKKTDLIKKDKLVMNSILQSVKTQNLNVKNYNYYKNKQDEIVSKVNRFKKFKEKENDLKDKFDTKLLSENSKTLELKKQLEVLEELEIECIKKLETTILHSRREIETLQKGKNLNLSSISLKFKAELQLIPEFTSTEINEIKEEKETIESNFKKIKSIPIIERNPKNLYDSNSNLKGNKTPTHSTKSFYKKEFGSNKLSFNTISETPKNTKDKFLTINKKEKSLNFLNFKVKKVEDIKIIKKK